MSNVGFIGVGYMGYGMAKNLLKKHNVFIFAHKNRKPINKLKKFGAKELKSYNKIKKHKNVIIKLQITRFSEIPKTFAARLAVTIVTAAGIVNLLAVFKIA